MKNKANTSILVLLFFCIGIIGFLVYYIRNKNKVDHEVSAQVTQEAQEAAKDYVLNGIQDIKDVWNGKKNYFG